MTKSSRSPARIVASLAERVPATRTREYIADVIARYFASFGTRAVDARLELFADDVRFEDPAGHTVAADLAALRHFWRAMIPSDWDIRFVLDRVAIVGDEALATATMTVAERSAIPVDVVVNCHFAFGDDGRICSYRAFYDAESILERR
jgi:steroid delta-isomerase